MALPAPSGRTEFFLAAGAGMEVNLPKAVSKEDKYLEGIVSRIDTLIDRIAETQDYAEGLTELSLAILIVDELPETGEANTIYLIRTNNAVTGARFAKYIWLDGAWETLSATEIIKAHIDAYFNELGQELYNMHYMSMEGKVLIFRGNRFAAVYSAQTSVEYAGQTVNLTISNSHGTATTTVEVEENGTIPASAFSHLSEGYNIIFCQTDLSQTPVNRLVGPTAILMRLTFEQYRQNPEPGGFLSFLSSYNLALDYVAVNPRPVSLDGDTEYYVKCYTSNTNLWDILNSKDGNYYNPISSLDDVECNEDIYVQVFTKLQKTEGRLLVFQSISNPVLRSVKTEAAYAERSAQITIINSGGEYTTSVTIGADGSIPLASFASVAQGYNFIFCETDPTQTTGNNLIGPTAVPLSLVCEFFNAPASGRLSLFLAAHNLRAVYTAVDPRPTELDSNTDYYVLRHTDDTTLWTTIEYDTENGDYYRQIKSLSGAENNEAIYTMEFVRTTAA